jgi:hypothetical protein
MHMVKQIVLGAAAFVLATTAAAAQGTQQNEAEQVRARQRIATMEAVLARAVSNGADNVMRQLRNVMPDQPMLAGAPRARGFRLEGYGVFFDVEVPLMRLPIMWPLRSRAFESRAATASVEELRLAVRQLPPPERARLERIITDIALQLEAAQPRTMRRGSVSAATVAAGPTQPQAVSVDVVNDPENAYTHEVKAALIDAMLENSGALSLAAEEWLSVAARDNAPRDPLVPGDTVDFSTWVFRVKGSDLAAFRAGRLSLDEARKKVEVREY